MYLYLILNLAILYYLLFFEKMINLIIIHLICKLFKSLIIVLLK